MNATPAALLDGRYRVGPVIARGGMSVVYRGVDVRLDRPVAIKVMNPALAADPAFRTRFEREARSAARIDHPAVVDVHDQGDVVGDDGPVLFLVMELVEGATLRDVLDARGAIGVPAAFAVIEPVLAGLAEAHRLGLVHRDVKPENVLVGRTGEVKVADFGLVTAPAQAGASHVGMIMGTVAYLSPEQVATGAADARSDVYAAGVLLYELLVGAPPYTGDTAISVAYRHVNCDVPAPSAVAGDVPPELDGLVRRATCRDPAGRPADAGVFLAELRTLARQLEVPRVRVPAPPAPAPATGPDRAPADPPGPIRRRLDGDAASPAGGPGGTRTLVRPHVAEDQRAGSLRYRRARSRSRRIFAGWVAVVVVLALLVASAAWWVGSGRWTVVPTVVGLPEATAQQLLTEAGLVATRTATLDERVPAGVVAASEQGADAVLLRGSAVALTISLGRPTVPDIAPGTDVAVAEQLVRAAGLRPGPRTTDSSDEVPAGAVLRTRPQAGAEVGIGAPVGLVLSTGAEDDGTADRVRVPRLVGRSLADAEDALDRLGLESERRRSRLGFDEDLLSRFGRRADLVVRQSHGPGSLVDPDTTIVLDTV